MTASSAPVEAGGKLKSVGWVTRLAVLFISLLNVEVSLVNTVLGEISKAFPDADPVMINLVSTMPVIFMFFSTLLVGRIGKKVDLKPLLILSLAIYVIGGVGGFLLAGSLGGILASRALVGIGAGLSAPLTGAIVARLFTGEERATMLGWSNAFSSLLTVGLTIVVGFLATMDWRYAFLAYGAFVLVLLLELVALPKIPPEVSSDAGAGQPKHAYQPRQKLKLALIALFVFCNLLAGMMIFMKMPIMVTQEGLGGPVEIASAMSLNTAAIFGVSLIFGWLTKRLGRYTLFVYLGFSLLAAITVLNAHSMPMVYLALALNGVGAAIMMPAIQFKAMSTGPASQASFAMSIVLGALFLGQFAASFVEKILAVFGNPTPRTMFLFSVVAYVVYIVAYLVWVMVVPADAQELAEPDPLAAPTPNEAATPTTVPTDQHEPLAKGRITTQV